MSNQKDTSFIGCIVGFLAFCFGMYFLFGWATIGADRNNINEMTIMSLNFFNAFTIGWADDLVVSFFYDGSPSALANFAHALDVGDREYGFGTLLVNLIGSFVSLGGLIAIALAANASSAGAAFFMAFIAEIIEMAVWDAGYTATTGLPSFTVDSLMVTLVIGVVMGCVAVGVFNKFRAKR